MTASVADASPRVGGRFAFAAIALLFCLQTYLQFTAPLIHDASWYLHVARGLLHGKHLYTDFIEVNPPLGMWLIVPVVWIADYFQLRADLTYKVFLLFISIASILLVNRYIKTVAWFSASRRVIFITAFAAGVLFLPGPDFGEREHLIALLFAPWLFLRVARNNGAKVNTIEAIAIGCFAAIAIVLKPQSVFAPLFFEALLLWQSRKFLSLFAPENLAAGVTVLLYGAAILTFTPEFLTDMVPLGRAAYMPFYGYPAWVQLFNARWTLLFVLMAFFALRFLSNNVKRLVLALLAAAVGFTLSYGLQNKGFSYQIMPASIFAWSALAVVVADLWSAGAKHAALLLVIAGLAALRLGTEPQQYRASETPFIAGMNACVPNAKSIFIASTRLSHGFPLVEDKNLLWASRLPTQWLAPYVASKWSVGPLPDDKVISLALDTTVSDLVQGKPDIIFIDEDQGQVYVPGGKFDYVKFWSNDPRFATFWQGYEQRGNIESFAVFTRK
jgi:hypothetical protein